MFDTATIVVAQAVDNAALFLSGKWRLWVFVLISVIGGWQILKNLWAGESGEGGWGKKSLFMTVFRWGAIMIMAMWVLSAGGQATLMNWLDIGTDEAQAVVEGAKAEQDCKEIVGESSPFGDLC